MCIAVVDVNDNMRAVELEEGGTIRAQTFQLSVLKMGEVGHNGLPMAESHVLCCIHK